MLSNMRVLTPCRVRVRQSLGEDAETLLREGQIDLLWARGGDADYEEDQRHPHSTHARTHARKLTNAHTPRTER